MQVMRRAVILASALIVVLVAAMILPGIAGAAGAEREDKANGVVTRRDEGGLAEAMAMVRKITLAGDRAVITYRAAGDKRPRSLVVEYSDLARALLYPRGGPPLYWAMLAMVGTGLALRLSRLSRIKEAQVPELMRRNVPPADR